MVDTDNSAANSEGLSYETGEGSSASSREVRTKVSKPASKSREAFRTISEVAKDLGVQQHVLRFWETKFSQVRPLKRGGGRRYYRPEDIELLKRIQHLLYTDGYTIKGVQKLIKAKGKKGLMQAGLPEAENSNQPAPPLVATRPLADSKSKAVDQAPSLMNTEAALTDMLSELKALRSFIADD